MCKRNLRVRVSKLTQSEYDVILREANFTQDQRKLFVELNRDQYYDFSIMEQLHITNREWYYELKGTVIDKVERIATQYGFIDKIRG